MVKELIKYLLTHIPLTSSSHVSELRSKAKGLAKLDANAMEGQGEELGPCLQSTVIL